jgi:hypothetical protein
MGASHLESHDQEIVEITPDGSDTGNGKLNLKQKDSLRRYVTMQENPVFIAGADRSGTSLLYALLASHPNISMVRRTNMWRYFYKRFGDLKDPGNFEQCLETMLRYKRMNHLSPDPKWIRVEFWQGEPTYGHLFSLFHRHLAESRGKPRWGDKSLHTEHYADQVFTEYPKAKIVQMIRDPRDRHASIKNRYQDKKQNVGTTTTRWISSIRRAQQNQNRYPENYMILRYETLASQPEQTLRQVCDFLAEPYVPEMLTMEGAPDHAGSGNSSFGEIQPRTISTRSIGRFRSALDPKDIAFIQTVAGSLMTSAGYHLESSGLEGGQRAQFWLAHVPYNGASMLKSQFEGLVILRRGEAIPDNRLASQDLMLETSPGTFS